MKRLLVIFLSILLLSCGIATAQTLNQKFLNMHNPLLNGPSCSNITLASAITAMGADQKTIYLTKTDRAELDCTWNIAADVVVPSNIHLYIPFGVIVSVPAGVTLTLNGPVTLESSESITGDGTYTFAYPEDSIGRSYVTSNCLSTIPVSLLIVPSFQCSAVIKYGNRSFEVHQDVSFVGPISNVAGAYWIGMHWNTTATVAGWTRQAGTKYLWRASVNAPDTPDGMVLIMKVLVDSNVIVLVGDIRPDSPFDGPVNAKAPMFGVASDCVTNDTAAIQQAANNAAWRAIHRLYMPAPLQRRCYYMPDGVWTTYNAAENINHPGNPLNLNGLVYDGHLEIFGDRTQYFSSLQSTSGGAGTVLQGTTGAIFKANSEYNENGSKNLALRHLTLKGTGTDPALSYLINFDAVAGLTIEDITCHQVNNGGSCIKVTDYDRLIFNRIVVQGPIVWDETLAAGSKGVYLSGIDTDNSGSSITGLHITGFDTCLEMGNVASGSGIATAHSVYNAITTLSCNTNLYISGTMTHTVYNAFQGNACHEECISIGDGARNITFIGGASSGVAATNANVLIGRGGTSASGIVFNNHDFLKITTIGVKIDSTNIATSHTSITNSRFDCEPAVGTMLNFANVNVRSGIFINNKSDTCTTMYTGIGGMGGFDLWNNTDYTAPEFNIKGRMRVTGASGATTAIQGMWSHSENIDFGVVPASNCTAWVPFTVSGVNVNNYLMPVKRPSTTPALTIIEADITNADEVSVRLCNIDDVDSANPAAADYDVIIMRMGQ